MKIKVRSYELIPSPVTLLHDTASIFKVVHHDEKENKPELLENYFNDIYHLFLNKLVRISHDANVSPEEIEKLKALFDELLTIKGMLQKED